MTPLSCISQMVKDGSRSLKWACLLGVAASCVGAGNVAADTFTWTGNSPFIIGIANNWGNPLNWQGGLIPVNDGTADVVMPDTPRDSPNLDQPWSINSLTFQGPGNYAVGGDPLTIDDVTHDGTGDGHVQQCRGGDRIRRGLAREQRADDVQRPDFGDQRAGASGA